MKSNFIHIAKRSTVAAKSALQAGTHEKAGFLAYHAFESSGCALGIHIGLDMGKTVSHAVKLKRFLHAAKSVGMGKEVSLMCVRLAPMRNRFLYPEVLLDGTVKLPEVQITSTKAKQLLREVSHIVEEVNKKL